MDRKYQFPVGASLALFLFGAWLLLSGWREARIATHEATAVGTINDIHKGRRSYYEYSYSVDGVTYSNDCDSCSTPLLHGMCDIGTQALVYYDRTHPGTSLLHEYGAESSLHLALGKRMTPVGALLLLAIFVYYQLHDSPPRDEDAAEDDNDEQPGPEILHIVPQNKEQ